MCFGVHKRISFSAVPEATCFSYLSGPSVETLGYCQGKRTLNRCALGNGTCFRSFASLGVANDNHTKAVQVPGQVRSQSATPERVAGSPIPANPDYR